MYWIENELSNCVNKLPDHHCFHISVDIYHRQHSIMSYSNDKTEWSSRRHVEVFCNGSLVLVINFYLKTFIESDQLTTYSIAYMTINIFDSRVLR